MSNTITTGVVLSSSSTTAGVIKTLAGTEIAYSDSTLSTRSIDLDLGEYVIFAYDNLAPATVGITPLTDIYSQGLTDANSGNEITKASIKRALQINNCCASYKGAQWIEKQEQQIPCDQLLEDAETMTAMIDSIVGFVPEGEIISGRQATYMITITGVGNPLLSTDINLTIGSATYTTSVSSASRTTTSIATAIATYVNTFYPQNYSYYAEASGANVILSGSDFNTSNGTAVDITITNGTATEALPNTLANGSASVAQGENGITNQQVQAILDKLDQICSTPCESVVEFENS